MAGERIVKILNAKRDEVFQAWSESGLVREWMHPGGRQLSNINMDFSPIKWRIIFWNEANAINALRKKRMEEDPLSY